MYPTRQCIANKQGDVSIVSISRAITIGTPQKTWRYQSSLRTGIFTRRLCYF